MPVIYFSKNMTQRPASESKNSNWPQRQHPSKRSIRTTALTLHSNYFENERERATLSNFIPAVIWSLCSSTTRTEKRLKINAPERQHLQYRRSRARRRCCCRSRAAVWWCWPRWRRCTWSSSSASRGCWRATATWSSAWPGPRRPCRSPRRSRSPEDRGPASPSPARTRHSSYYLSCCMFVGLIGADNWLYFERWLIIKNCGSILILGNLNISMREVFSLGVDENSVYFVGVENMPSEDLVSFNQIREIRGNRKLFM